MSTGLACRPSLGEGWRGIFCEDICASYFGARKKEEAEIDRVRWGAARGCSCEATGARARVMGTGLAYRPSLGEESAHCASRARAMRKLRFSVVTQWPGGVTALCAGRAA